MKKILSFAVAAMLILMSVRAESALIPVKTVELAPIADFSGDYTVYVSPDGNDSGDGSAAEPVQTVGRAVEVAAEMIKTASVIIELAAGEYTVTEPVLLTGDMLDGANGHILTISGNGNAVISGGKPVTGWQKSEIDNVWQAKLENTDMVHGFYVDGSSMTIAEKQIYGGFTTGKAQFGIRNILGETWNNWGSYSTLTPLESVTFTSRDLYEMDIEALAADTANAYFLMNQTFRTDRFEIARIENNNDINFSIMMSDETLKTIDYNHMSDYDYSQDKFYICNTLQVLDKEGEYCFDRLTGTLYYYTKEDPNSKDCRIPVAEGLLRIEGTRKGLAGGLRLDGITFRYSCEPVFMTHPFIESQCDSIGYAYIESIDGVQDKKGCRYMLPGQIYMKYASNITITNCEFTNMESTAIQMESWVYDVTIDSCRFDSLAGSAIECGKIDENTGYGVNDKNPLPESYIDLYSVGKKTNFTPMGIRISNNTITNCGLKYIGGTGILVYYANACDIINNTIENISGCGIAVGWGWSNKSLNSQGNDGNGSINIIANYIKAPCMKSVDAAGIYTLGYFLGDGCYVGNNFIDMKGAYDNGIPGIYLDEGSEFVYVTNNLTINSRMWLSERALPLLPGGSGYVVGSITRQSMMNCIIDSNYSNKKCSTHYVGAADIWPSASVVVGSNFIVGEEIVIKNWSETPETAAIAEGAGAR